MAQDIFQVRERALEYDFFHKIDEQLWQRMRRQLKCDQCCGALEDATGITDSAVLTELAELEISSETIFALSLFPLVWVAWVDGQISPQDRQFIMEAAHKVGHEQDTPSHQLLETWLDHEPDANMQSAWKDYVRALCDTISVVALRSLKRDIVERTRKIADALIVRYGFHDVEAVQKAILDEIEKAFGIV